MGMMWEIYIFLAGHVYAGDAWPECRPFAFFSCVTNEERRGSAGN